MTRKILRIIAINLFIFFDLFLLLDFASRWFLPARRSPIERTYHVERIRHPQPYVMFGGIPNSPIGGGERLNDLGYREQSPRTPKAPGEIRIFVLGGSTVFAGNPTIPAALEERFKQQGWPQVKVYNFGVVSSSSGMELARVVHDVSNYQPDLIIFYNGANDMANPLQYDPRPNYPLNFLVYENNPVLESDVNKYPTFYLMAYGSNLLRFLLPDFFVHKLLPLEDIRRQVGYNTDPWRQQIADRYLENLMKANRISQAFGARFIAFLQPTVYFKDKLSGEEKIIYNKSQPQHFLWVCDKIRTQYEQVKKRDDLLLIDLTDIFDDVDKTVFVDHIHIYNDMTALLVQEIFEHSRPLVDAR